MWRIRAHLRFTVASGLGQWCFDQNVVRLSQASHLQPGGQRSDELSHHEVVDGKYLCDLIFGSDQEALAVDTYTTITAASVVHPLNMLAPDGNAFSWAQIHECHHDQVPPGACMNVTAVWSDEVV